MTDQFPPNSRYRGVRQVTRVTPDGRTETFVTRRIIPAVERFGVHHRVRTDDMSRIDRVAAEALGDPELYWRICDANGDADPAEATRPSGRLLVIPLPLEVSDDGES